MSIGILVLLCLIPPSTIRNPISHPSPSQSWTNFVPESYVFLHVVRQLYPSDIRFPPTNVKICYLNHTTCKYVLSNSNIYQTCSLLKPTMVTTKTYSLSLKYTTIRISIYQNYSTCQPTAKPTVKSERFTMNTYMRKSQYLPSMFIAKIDSLSLRFIHICIQPCRIAHNIY